MYSKTWRWGPLYSTFKASQSTLSDKAAIRTNAVKRALPKLCLNSMWRKLTERKRQDQNEDDLRSTRTLPISGDDGIELMNLMFASHDLVWNSWRFIAENIPILPQRSPWGICDVRSLHASVLQSGTFARQSAILRHWFSSLYSEGNWAFPEKTEGRSPWRDNELKPVEFIDEFVSVGPKIYAYRICVREEPNTVCKVREITLNYNTSRLVNLDVIRDILNSELGDTVSVHKPKILNEISKDEQGKKNGVQVFQWLMKTETKFFIFFFETVLREQYVRSVRV